MLRILLRSALLAAVAALPFVVTSPSQAQTMKRDQCASCSKCEKCRGTACRSHEYGRPDLFYNYYVDPSCGAVPAQMYIAPRPVPPLVGQTYYTYQPLMPHEMLYRHHRSYHRYYNEGRGLTRTHVIWW